MSDIIDDLLNLHGPGRTNYTCLKAADEIKQLRESERSAWNAAVDREADIDALKADLAAAQRALTNMVAAVDAERKRAERAEADLAAVQEILPGVYYMDPPDGGDVALIEQMRRLAKDAERYRWIKKQSIKMATAKDDFYCYDADYTVSILFRKRPPSLKGYILVAPQGNELDAAIDAALDKQRSGE